MGYPVRLIISSLLLFSCTSCVQDMRFLGANEHMTNSMISTDPIPGSESAPLGLVGNISKEEFKGIINKVVDIYIPLAKERGAKLYLRAPADPGSPEHTHPNDVTEDNFTRNEVLEKMWEIDVPNAHSTKNLQTNSWYLTFNGGLARQPELQAESFILIVCHEIGHYFGGFPLYLTNPIHGRFVMPLASEGQADYYASQVCAKRIWKGEANDTDRAGTSYKVLAGTVATDTCNSLYSALEDRNLCYKIAYAGTQVGALWHRFKNDKTNVPSLETPDGTQVDETVQMEYPLPQCRLDTYFNGGICPTVSENINQSKDVIFYDLHTIPGIDHPNGPDSIAARDASRKMTCGVRFPQGARPRCWFHPEFVSDSPYDPNDPISPK